MPGYNYYGERAGAGGGRYNRPPGRSGGGGRSTGYGGGYGGKGSGGNYNSGYGGGGGGSGGGYGRNDSHGYGRYGGGPSKPVVSPWESGMAPNSGPPQGSGLLPTPGGSGHGMMGSGSSNLLGSLSQLSHLGNNESKLALDIINAVLTTAGSHDGREDGPPMAKMRRFTDGRPGGYDDRRVRHRSPTRPRKIPGGYRDQTGGRPRDYRGPGPFNHRNAGPGNSGSWGYGHHGSQYGADQPRKRLRSKRGKPRFGPKGDDQDKKDQDKQKKQDSEEANSQGVKPEVGDGEDQPEASEAQSETVSGEGTKEEGGKADKQEDGAEGKKDDETKDDDTEKKEDAKKDDKTPKKDVKKDQKQRDDIPPEHLICHMCEISGFPSVKSYLHHLESKAHEESSHSYHTKNANILQLLRSEAKLACLRQIQAARKAGTKGRIMQCFKCHCRIFGSLQKHMKTIEHQILNNFMNVKCCGRWYNNRADFEEHKLSLVHLRRQMEKELRKQEREAKEKEEAAELAETTGGDELSLGDESTLVDKLDALKKSKDEGQLNLQSLPPYDPANTTGISMIVKKTLYHCKVCWTHFQPHTKMAEVHCRTAAHYKQLVKHLNTVEAKKREAEEKKKAEAAAASEAAPKEVKTEENEGGDGGECSMEDMDNMETVDEAVDESFGENGEATEEGTAKGEGKDASEKGKGKDVENGDANASVGIQELLEEVGDILDREAEESGGALEKVAGGEEEEEAAMEADAPDIEENLNDLEEEELLRETCSDKAETSPDKGEEPATPAAADDDAAAEESTPATPSRRGRRGRARGRGRLTRN